MPAKGILGVKEELIIVADQKQERISSLGRRSLVKTGGIRGWEGHEQSAFRVLKSRERN